MMALISLQLILMFFFAILWTSRNGNRNWFDGWHDFDSQAIQEEVAALAGGRAAEKCGTQEEPRILTVSDGSQIPIVTNTPISNSLSLKY